MSLFGVSERALLNGQRPELCALAVPTTQDNGEDENGKADSNFVRQELGGFNHRGIIPFPPKNASPQTFSAEIPA